MNNKNILINKIANSINIEDVIDTNEVKDKALKIASTMLKVAADKIRESNDKIAELSSTIEGIQKESEDKSKRENIDNLVYDMFNKGLIKKSDIDTKKQELYEADNTALKAIKSTISLIPEKNENDGISDLTFLYQGNNIKEKETLSSALEGFSK